MFRASNSFLMFMGDQVNDYLALKKQGLQSSIEHIKTEDFLERDETDLINDLVEKFKIDAPVIDFENITVSSYEKQIPAEHFPQTYYVISGKSYLKQVIVYHLPFTGNDELFRLTPSHFTLWSPEVYIEDQNVCFEFVNFGDMEEIKREAQRSIESIKFFYNAMLQDIGNHDTQLRANIEQMVKARKQKIIDDNNKLAALGMPINTKRFPFGLGQNSFSAGAKAVPSTDGVERVDRGWEVKGVREIDDRADANKPPQRLHVFLCHSSGDKPQVRKLYKRLTAEGVEAWLDEESLLPGQDWELEISRAIRGTHVVIVCLSQSSTTKRGYVQKEIKFALDEADKQPEGTIFIIPVKVEECDLPDRLRRYHTVDLFEERGFEKLVRALRSRTSELGLSLTSILN